MNKANSKEKGAFTSFTSPEEEDEGELSQVDDMMSPPPVSGCFMFMCFAPGGQNVAKSKSKQKDKAPRKGDPPKPSNDSVNSVNGSGASNSQSERSGDADSSVANSPKLTVSEPSDPIVADPIIGGSDTHPRIGINSSDGRNDEAAGALDVVSFSTANSAIPPSGPRRGLSSFSMGDSGNLGYSASSESFSAAPQMQLQGNKHGSDQPLRQYPSSDFLVVPQSKASEPPLLSKSSFDYAMSAIRDTAAEVDSSKRMSSGRTHQTPSHLANSSSRDAEAKEERPGVQNTSVGRGETGEVSSELDAAPLSASERLRRAEMKSNSGSIDSRDRDRTSPMRVESSTLLSTLPPIAAPATTSGSVSRSTATAAFVAALRVNSNGQSAPSGNASTPGSLGGAPAVIGPINTSGSGAVEWSKMFELTGVRFDKTQPGPGESVPTLGDQHLLKLEEALKQNIQKVNVERNRTALTRNSSFNIASVIDLAGAVMPSPPPAGSAGAAASQVAPGGSIAPCAKLVDLSLAYTEILQLQNRPKEAVKVLSKVIEDVNSEMAELVRRYGLSSGKTSSPDNSAPQAVDRSALPSAGGAAEAVLEKSSGVSREEYDEIRRLKAMCHRRIGSMYMSLGKYKQAEDHIKKYLSYLEKQRKISSSANQRVERSYAYSVLSSIYDATGRPEEAMAADIKSLELSLQYRRSLAAAAGGGGAGPAGGGGTAASPGSKSETTSRGAGSGDARNASKAVLV